MAKRISETLGEKDRKAAVRTARTACTSAENLGRIHSYQWAERMGIVLKKQWMSAHDSRTRDWHRELDGVSVPINEPFENAVGKIRYPGDFSAAGANVYNCRCCLVAAVNRHEIDGSEVYRKNHSPELDGISWEDWKKGKKHVADLQKRRFTNSGTGSIIEKTADDYLKLSDEELKQYYGKLDNKTVRLWYKAKNQMIPEEVDKTRTLREQAIEACNRRNENRTLARELMKDSESRKQLDRNRPNKTFDELLRHKIEDFGLSETDAYRDIIRSSATTNEEFDRKAGV